LRLDDWKTENFYRAARVAAEKNSKGRSALDRILEEERFERSIVLDQIAQVRTGRLVRTAVSYDIDVPLNGDNWEESSTIGGRQLTTKGFHELRVAIRKEQNERWTYWELRLKVVAAILTAATGAAGALIGLAAILKK